VYRVLLPAGNANKGENRLQPQRQPSGSK
jgi:hypothetical protein